MTRRHSRTAFAAALCLLAALVTTGCNRRTDDAANSSMTTPAPMGPASAASR